MGHHACNDFNRCLTVRLFRFGLIGLLMTGLHFAIAVSLIKWGSVTPPMANGVAFLVSTIASYMLNTVWSFSRRIEGRTLIRFISVSLFGFFFTYVVASSVEYLGYRYLIGVFAVAFIVPPFTFLMHNYWTYR